SFLIPSRRFCVVIGRVGSSLSLACKTSVMLFITSAGGSTKSKSEGTGSQSGSPGPNLGIAPFPNLRPRGSFNPGMKIGSPGSGRCGNGCSMIGGTFGGILMRDNCRVTVTDCPDSIVTSLLAVFQSGAEAFTKYSPGGTLRM